VYNDPSLLWEIITDAPKLAGPWKKITYVYSVTVERPCWIRRDRTYAKVGFIQKTEDGLFRFTTNETNGTDVYSFETLEESKRHLDEHLTSAGWKLA
jgi:hypothetical protein